MSTNKFKISRLSAISHSLYLVFNESCSLDASLLGHVDQKKIIFDVAGLPVLGSVVRVCYIDINFVTRFVVGFCIAVKKKGTATSFSIYSKPYGLYFTFFIYSTCFLGFSRLDLQIQSRKVVRRKSYFFLCHLKKKRELLNEISN